jgi:virulence factor
MLKVGLVGLGDIAQKAYLPVLSKKPVELHLYTRDQAKLRRIGDQYRFINMHRSLDELMASRITAAFVHTSTESHKEIITSLLENNIHVFVDKPITYDYDSAAALCELAKNRQLLLNVGFNRRYAPAIQDLTTLSNVNMIVMQKNRNALPGIVRTFVFDDFIHVVDTLLYLSPSPVVDWIVNGRKKENLLYHVVVQFFCQGGEIMIGIMNRDCGTTEEKLEIFSTTEKRIVANVTEAFVLRDKNTTELGVNDWESTLSKRGFENMVDDFLEAVGSETVRHDESQLLTHKICEQIVEKLESQ